MSLPGRFVNIAGNRVFYHRSGPVGAKTLVLVHGFLVSHWVWRHVIPRLNTTYDVIAIDLPGFGESDRPKTADYHYDAPTFMDTLIAVLDALGVEKATLCGHSMGGAICLYTAARRPERVDKLVLVDPLVYPPRIPFAGRVVLMPFIGELIMTTFYTRSVISHAMKTDIYLDPNLVTPEWVDYVWERVNRPGGFGAAHAALRFVSDPAPITRCTRAVRAPTAIVWGESDRLFPAAHAERLANDIAGTPRPEVHVISVCGHSPVEERPEEFLRCLGPFLGLGAHLSGPKKQGSLPDKRATG